MIEQGFQTDQHGYWIEKKQGSILDYGFFWGAWLKGDTIASSSWELPAALSEVSSAHDDGTTSVVISGWVDGETYVATNTIVTAGGLTDDRSFRIICV